MRKFLPVFLLIILVIATPQASADQISDPENVTYMKAGVTQSGHITLTAESSVASAEDLTLRLYIPQQDSRQSVSVERVIGPDDYSFEDDGSGNTQIVLVWEKPRIGGEIDYLLETIVEVEAGPSREARYFPVTPVIEPSKGIIETAYTVGGGERSVRNMLLLSNWVHANVEYDLGCEEQAFAAEWVFNEGRGTCDEFSNLLLSMLRTLDYNAWYVAGYAYLSGKQEGGEAFGSHAWVEGRLASDTYSFDPTWAESPVDATHIAFARLPDSNFTEHTEVKSRDISISWEKDETRFQVIDFRQEPRIRTSVRSVPESVSGGKNVMIIADMEADGCVATNLRIASCVDEEGDDLIDIAEKRRPVSFCHSATFYWFGETASISRGVRYSCPVTVAGGGGLAKSAVSITSEPQIDVRTSASAGKILVPGQVMELSLSARNNGFSRADLQVFAMLGDEMKEGILGIEPRDTDRITLELTAPQAPGAYNLYVFTSSGDLMTEGVEVISERHLKITEITMPTSMEIGSNGTVKVSVTNLGEDSIASVRFQAGGTSETKTVKILGGDEHVLSFDFAAENEGDNAVIISVLDSEGSYEDSWTGSINVFRRPSLKEEVSGGIEAIIMAILEFLRNLFGA
jgi:transglutaminase-like putative cysteine protease